MTELRKQVDFLQKEHEKYRAASNNQATAEGEGKGSGGGGYRSFQEARKGKGGAVSTNDGGVADVGVAGGVGDQKTKRQGKRARLRKWVGKAAFWR